jgi:hypothetical protein
MGLSADEKKLLEELTAKAKEPDAPESEIEIWDGSKGARVPFSQGSKWLFDNFGIGEAPAPPEGGQGGDGGGDGGGQGGQGGQGADGKGSYFKRQAGK